ncbi:flavodoxin family protein [Amycolatopsis alba]|uniref:Flavodoxin n=1 Tax=Amycolatopsis alba DSM 44262 TaxID=1125972 RepID=A0A229RHJ2_AMYAL|nr:flavodoxin domain-containing protein [Amycolatopsis alba]OXM46117.1 flavodoxin [Amycolatopsis alba DSM 44262]
MRAMVVYESMSGNTEQVAKAVGEGLGRYTEVSVVNVDDVRSVPDADLLVVGGPTHVHGLSWPSSRSEAARQALDDVRSSTGLREWLGTLNRLPGGPVAAFDTRMGKPRWLTGSAAVVALRRLRRLGRVPLVPPESFLVETDGQQPVLRAGELDRAREWGAALGRRFASVRKTGRPEGGGGGGKA